MSEDSSCGVGCAAGPKGEMLLCGFKEGHGGPHAWATLPTWLTREEWVKAVRSVTDSIIVPVADNSQQGVAEKIVEALLVRANRDV